MDSEDSPRTAHRHRSRQRESSSRRNHQRTRRPRSSRPGTASDDAGGDGGAQSLSAGALAQLNQENVRQQRQGERRRREGRRDRERDHDRDRNRDRERDRDRDRNRDRDRDREKDRDRDRDRNRDRDGDRNRTRDRVRERERDRDGRERHQARYGERADRLRDGYEDPEEEEAEEEERTPLKRPRKTTKSKKSRVVSGAAMEEGRSRGTGLRGGHHSREDSMEEKEQLYFQKTPKKKKKKSKKKLWIILGCSAVILLIIIIVAVVVSKKNKSSSGSSSGSSSSNSNIPAQWQGTYLDPSTWATTDDFNTTFTAVMVGDLPIMGLYTDWSDSAQANANVPPLNQSWGSYTTNPARGVNLGGWLSLEPFITPSLFNYPLSAGVIDEWTLSQKLGPSTSQTIENHYATFVTEDTFKDIQAAGLDHVRIPFSYWAVQTYDNDPYLFRTSWRYLLRGIEWARKYGLRVNLDLHGLPGSQNGWNHSGRWGTIGWLNGTNGQLNANRSLDIHNRLSQFFAQDRYKNIITHYGLANEPRMTSLNVSQVVNWTETAYSLVRQNGINALVIFGDGFMGLENWKGVMQGYDDLVLDVHQYVIFNQNQIDYTHQEKVQYACTGWTEQAEQSLDTSTGYGPTLFAEFSQADTDCAKFLTNVGWGNRWEGTYNTGDAGTSILTPTCPDKNSSCSCSGANADASAWSPEYKSFLKMFAEAQMYSFEKGWGWWYWTWKTENASQWSYQAGLSAGVLPQLAYQRDFNCDSDVPDFSQSGLPEYY